MFVKVTPVAALQATPLSDAIVPAPVTSVTVTANEFGFVALDDQVAGAAR